MGQLEALQRAREKAAQVRAKNTELRRKEREVVNAQLEENRRIREETIKREHAERFQKEQQAKPKPDEGMKDAPAKEEQEEEPEVVYQKKPKRKKKIVVVQQESSDDEQEIEVQL